MAARAGAPKKNGNRISVGPNRLGAAVSGILEGYGGDVAAAVSAAAEESARDMVGRTRRSAPRGRRHGRYASRITCKMTRESADGQTWTWYVRPPEHALSHLLEHGHGIKWRDRGGRLVSGSGSTRAFGFIAGAFTEAERGFERRVREAVRRA